MSLTIRHTHQDGTILEGTAKGDGSNVALKAAGGWRWSRNLGAWYIQNSRDRDAVQWKINRAAEALRSAGFTVEVDIDNTARPIDEVEADKRDRLEARAEALDAKVDRRIGQAQVAEAVRADALARVPEGGEPIKIGHHSEARHRKSIDRAWTALGKSVEAHKAVEEAERRAEACRANVDYRESPRAIVRRIGRLEVEARKWQKTVDAYTARGEVSERHNEGLRREQEKIAYWKTIHEQQVADGLITMYDRSMVKAGDFVKIKGRWNLVAKANPKTVAVDASAIFGTNHTLPYAWLEVEDHRTAEQIAEARSRKEAEAALAQVEGMGTAAESERNEVLANLAG